MNEVRKISFRSRYLKQKEENCDQESDSLGISDFEGKNWLGHIRRLLEEVFDLKFFKNRVNKTLKQSFSSMIASTEFYGHDHEFFGNPVLSMSSVW